MSDSHLKNDQFLTNLDVLVDLFYYSALDGGLTQDVVWSDACLTTVDKLTPRDATVLGENNNSKVSNLEDTLLCCIHTKHFHILKLNRELCWI